MFWVARMILEAQQVELEQAHSFDIITSEITLWVGFVFVLFWEESLLNVNNTGVRRIALAWFLLGNMADVF